MSDSIAAQAAFASTMLELQQLVQPFFDEFAAVDDTWVQTVSRVDAMIADLPVEKTQEYLLYAVMSLGQLQHIIADERG